MKIAILAGGSGTRVWPGSRAHRPKQFLRLAAPERSLLQETVDRILPLVSLSDILIVTGRDLIDQVAEQLPSLPRENIIGEPCGRGSAPAIGLAATVIEERWGPDVMVSLHADHHIAHPEILRRALTAAAQVAAQGRIVTLGVVPTRPHTGMGHIQRGELLGEFGGLPVYAIACFQEKPDLPTATFYVESGEYYWNTGMFVWQTSTILSEIAAYMPQLAGTLAALRSSPVRSTEHDAAAQLWSDMVVQQIDFGVMEHTRLGAVVAVDNLGWSDIGDWNALGGVRPADEQGNVIAAPFVSVDTTNSIVFGTGRRLIAAIGLDSMVIVETDDAILVCPRSRSQDVKKLVEKLKKEKKDQYL